MSDDLGNCSRSMIDEAAMCGSKYLEILRQEVPQAVQICPHVTIGWSDHHARSVHDVIPGEAQVLRIEEIAKMIRRMPWGGEDLERKGTYL